MGVNLIMVIGFHLLHTYEIFKLPFLFWEEIFLLGYMANDFFFKKNNLWSTFDGMVLKSSVR